jgi:hypothetical protein
MSVKKPDSNGKEALTAARLDDVQKLQALQAELANWCQRYRAASAFLDQDFYHESETTWQFLKLAYLNLDSLVLLASNEAESRLREALE